MIYEHHHLLSKMTYPSINLTLVGGFLLIIASTLVNFSDGYCRPLPTIIDTTRRYRYQQYQAKTKQISHSSSPAYSFEKNISFRPRSWLPLSSTGSSTSLFNDSKGNEHTSNQNGEQQLESRTLLMSKLDWFLPIPEITHRISGYLLRGKETRTAAEDDDSSVKREHSHIFDKDNFEIHVAPKSNQKRDADKCNGGRALLIFNSREEAQMAMRTFDLAKEKNSNEMSGKIRKEEMLYGDENIGNFTVQWATPMSIQKLAHIQQKEEEEEQSRDSDGLNNSEYSIKSLPEAPKEEKGRDIILHRKQRAEKYARQRRNVGRRTDDAICSINEYLGLQFDTHGSDDAGDDLEIMDDFLDAPPIDWERRIHRNLHSSRIDDDDIVGYDDEDVHAIPSVIDPVRGGGLKSGSERGQRKQAQVESFLYVLNEVLLAKDQNDSGGESTSTTGEAGTKNDKQNIVADLGSGAGNLSLPLAWFLNLKETEDKGIGTTSKAKVLAVDINGRALERLQQRARELECLGGCIDTLELDISNLVHFDKLSDLERASYTKSIGGNIPEMDSDEGYNSQDPLRNCSAIVSLHACGAASDLAIAAAVQRSIPFAVSPCCIGKVKATRSRTILDLDTHTGSDRRKTGMPSLSLSASERSAAPDFITYPRSKVLRDFEIAHSKSSDKSAHAKTYDSAEGYYNLIVNAADYNPPPPKRKHAKRNTTQSKELRADNALNRNEEEVDKMLLLQRKRGRMAKRIIETDRLKWAEEQGYTVKMMSIPRLGPNYPKREILIGAKSGSVASTKILQLPHQ